MKKCIRCNGQGKTAPLGAIQRTCDDCDGAGYTLHNSVVAEAYKDMESEKQEIVTGKNNVFKPLAKRKGKAISLAL